MGSPGEIVQYGIATILLVYIAFVMTDGFCKSTPNYCVQGWFVFAGLVAGAAYFLKVTLFDN